MSEPEAPDETAGGLDPAPPDPAAWARIPDDDFAGVVAHARRALAALDDDLMDRDVARLRSTPASRLVRGNGRRRLIDALAAGGPLWVGVRTRLARDPELVARVRAVVDRGATPDPDGDASPDAALLDRLARAEQVREDLRAQRDTAREERDEARRQRDGAEGREASLRDDLARAREELADLRTRLADHEREAAAASRAREDAVARESRRGDARRRALEADLATARRELDELRRARSAPAPGRKPVTTPTRRGTTGPPPGTADRPGVDRVAPGRPSRLPRGTRLDSREGAEALVVAVGRLLVDGYNVTRTHRADLDLAGQRDWLVRGLGALAARRGLDVEVVFDAHHQGTASGRRQAGVQVSYTHPGISADDEIVFAVEATDVDRPLVVVTDDRELRDRLAPARVDLLPTASLVWLLG